MSVYLPKLDSYPISDPELFVHYDSSERKKKPRVTPRDNSLANKIPVHLPDIRLTNTPAQVTNFSDSVPNEPPIPFVENFGTDHHRETKVTFGVNDNTNSDVIFGKGAESDSNFLSRKADGVPRGSLRDQGWATVKDALGQGKDNRKGSKRSVLEGRRKSRRSGSLHALFQQLQRSASQSSSGTEESKVHFYDSVTLRKKFQKAIKAVVTIRKLAAGIIKKSDEPSAMLKTFTDFMGTSHGFTKNLKNQGLSFDPSYFKANREISISSEVKNILNLPPSARTQEQIQTAMYGLQSLQSFAEYPLHMQEKLAKVAWYEVVPPKRTIIRQGHYAENFYFILTGQAVVTILIRDPNTGESHIRTANFMRKGTSFGELALLHHSRRTATVTSQDTVQLLSIGREDFFDIFMSRHGPDHIPEHVKFISQLEFMKGWPIDLLLEHPEHCLLHFFKQNMVIVKDSKQSEWLYIVKSGSCQVLKQLHGVTARLGVRKHLANTDDTLPHTGTSIRGPKIDTGIRKTRPKSERFLFQLFPEVNENIPPVVNGESSHVTTKGPNTSPETDNRSAFPSRSPREGKKFTKSSFIQTPATGKVHFAVNSSPGEFQSRLSGPRKQRLSFLDQQSHSSLSTERSLSPPPVFVQVAHLKPKDVFGLELVVFHDDGDDSLQTSVSLVSRGAECIMLSKDFFRKHATDKVKKNLQDIVHPYPDEVAFQESLQRKADWELFKHTLIEDLTSPPVL